MSTDPITRARRAAARMDTHRAALSRLADERAAAVNDAIASGMSRSDVAAALGISKQALSLVIKRKQASADVLGYLEPRPFEAQVDAADPAEEGTGREGHNTSSRTATS